MATTTTNFGWDIPQSTDLVKDGATAIAALGQDIDTAFVDLKGGTTGQVLAKASNTDLDYSWINAEVGDITAVTAGTGISGGGTSGAVTITNSMATAIDAKGDLIAGTGADAFSRIAVGTNGQVLTADSTAATGLAWTTASAATSLGFTAGKNKLINGDFNIWQRGTSFSGSSQYTADRWLIDADTSGFSQSRQAFTAGAAPVTGYESQYFMRTVRGTGGTYCNSQQRIEDVRTYANQTVTLSFWAKASASCTIEPFYIQSFGSGGSGAVSGSFGTTTTLTTSWVRYSYTVAIPSVSGKTIGASSYLNILVARITSATNVDVDTWGVQLEAGSTLTAFQTATGTLAGELAACQRYYFRHTAATSYSPMGMGQARASTSTFPVVNHPVQMRIAPTSIEFSTLAVTGPTGSVIAVSAITLDYAGTLASFLNTTVASGLTAGDASLLVSNASTSGYLGLSAEL
jgi:hypothetical protein